MAFYDFGIFEKLKEIYNGIWNFCWKISPIAAFVMLAKWFWTTWLPAKAINSMEWIQGQMPSNLHVDLNTVNIAWSRINQFVPLDAIMIFGSAYMLLAGSLTVVKWVGKFIPG